MKPLIKKIISIPVVALFVFIAYFTFSSSLNNDSYVHLLKDSFVDDVSQKNLQFVGFEGSVVSSERDIVSKYKQQPVVYFKLQYQNYVCRSSGDSQKCSWETYNTETDSTPFTASVNGVEVNVRQLADVEFKPKNTAIFDKTDDYRVIQSVIKKNEPIYMWGLLENSEIKVYDDLKHGKQTLIVTDSARQTLIDLVPGVLYVQLLSAAIIVVMIILLFLINRTWKEKSYIATNYAGLPSLFKKEKKQSEKLKR